MTTLTFRQERFALEYLKDQNASAAAARAGYQAKNMAAQGHELLNNPAIRERVRIEMDAILAEIRCSALALMKQRMKAAFFDAGKLFKGGWELRAPEELDAETRAAVEVTSVTRKSGPVVRMKQPDRHRALRALERVHERLDRLNEAHYAALAKAGKVKTLEEIEAMDAGEAPAEISEKCRVLSGAGFGLVSTDAGTAVKTQGLSGLVTGPSPPNVWNSVSGLGHGTRPSTGSGRTVEGRRRTVERYGMTAEGCGISEKPRVLSGAPGRLSPLAAALRGINEAALAAYA